MGVVVDLVAAAVVGDITVEHFAAKLKPAVDVMIADDAVREFEFEVAEFAALIDEVVVSIGDFLFGALGCDCGVFDGPVGHVGGLPALEGLAVEDGGEVLCTSRLTN